MKVKNVSSVLTKTKSKNTEHKKVKQLKRVLTKKFNSKSYDEIETISLSKKKNSIVRRASYVGTYFRKDKNNSSGQDQVKNQELSHNLKDDKKTNIITFIHSNGHIESNMDLKNKAKHINNLNTNGTLSKGDKGDKRRDIYLTSKVFNPNAKTNGTNEDNNNNTQTKRGIVISNNLTKDIFDSDIDKSAPNNNKNFHNQSLTNKIPFPLYLKSTKPKSKLSSVVNIFTADTVDNDKSIPLSEFNNKPSAPSLNEMYLEEVKNHEKYLLYRDLIQYEKSESLSNYENETSSLESYLPLASPYNSNQHHSSIITPESIQYQNSIQNLDPFEPPFTTVSTDKTTSSNTFYSIHSSKNKVRSFPSSNSTLNSSSSLDNFDHDLIELPQPTSLSYYTQNQNSPDHDTIPPKIKEEKYLDNSVEKVIPKIDLISRRDSLDFYFDKLSEPCKKLADSIKSSNSTNSDSNISDSNQICNYESDILFSEKSQQRMMSEPLLTLYSVGHYNFQGVMKETLKLRNKLEDELEKTKFQMMIAITQLNLINEQLDILKY